MDNLISYVHSKPSILRSIVESNNDHFIESTYRLFLHYGLSCKKFFQIGLDHEFKHQEINSIFRNDQQKMVMMMIDFFKQNCGDLASIIEEINSLTIRHKASTSSRGLKKAVSSAIECLDQHLFKLLSESLIDFCGSICIYANSFGENSGEKIVGSFIFFRILAPKLYKTGAINRTDADHILKLIKIINRISTGNTDEEFKKYQKFIQEKFKNYQNLIAKGLMGRRESDYLAKRELKEKSYDRWKNIFIEQLKEFRMKELNLRKLNKSKATERLNFSSVHFSLSPRSPSASFKSSSFDSPHHSSRSSSSPSRKEYQHNLLLREKCLTNSSSSHSSSGRLSQKEFHDSSPKIFPISNSRSASKYSPLIDRKNLAKSVESKDSVSISIEKISNEKGSKTSSSSSKVKSSEKKEKKTSSSSNKVKSSKKKGSKPSLNNNDLQPLNGSYSLDFLLKAVSKNEEENLKLDIKFLALWDYEDVIDLVLKENMNPDFFEFWKIRGKTLINLDTEMLIKMGYNDDIENIDNFLKFIKKKAITNPNEINSQSLTNWTSLDIQLWLVLSNLDSYLNIFESYAISGKILANYDWNDFPKIGIYDPKNVQKIMQLVDDSGI